MEIQWLATRSAAMLVRMPRSITALVLLGCCSIALSCSGGPPAQGARQPQTVAAPVQPQVVALAPQDAGDDGSLMRISAANPSDGSAEALVTVVAFVNPQCKHSAVAMKTLDTLRGRFPAEIMRVVWKNYPIAERHPKSREAAEAAMAVHATAGSAAFFCFTRALYANPSGLGRELYRSAAGGCGASADRMEAEVASGRPARQVDADLELARSLQVIGTPTFFINGTRIEGAEEEKTYEAFLEAESMIARRAVAAGTPPARVHARRVQANFQIANDRTEAPEPVDKAVYKVPVAGSPVLGPASAPVTIVVFSDFQCPFCKQGAHVVGEVRHEFGARVRFAFKHMPLVNHRRAEPAAEFASEARAQLGDAGFWKAHDALFASPGLEDADLDVLSAALHLNAAAARAAVASHKYAAAIEADGQLADSIGVNATPTFFVNGRKLEGARPIEDFRALIQEVLPAAEELARRVPPGKVYEETIKTGVSKKR
jgi:protein-disulfide isomerase